MKLTNREMNLLGVVVALALLTGSYYGIIDPQLKAYDDLKQQQAQLEIKYNDFKRSLSPNNGIYNDFAVMDNKVKDVTSLFFPELRQEKFIVLLVQHLKAAGVDPSTILFNKVSDIKLLTPEGEGKKDSEKGAADELVYQYRGLNLQKPVDPTLAAKEHEKTQKMLKSVTMQMTSLTFRGSYTDLINLLQQIESYPRRITIEEVSSLQEGSQLVSTIKLGYYALPKIHKDQDKDFYEWTPSGPAGKKNPYTGISLANISTSASTTVANSSPSDFFLMLNPIISDLTTVVMSKMSDRSRSSYVYADNSGVEPVTFELIQKDNKYYYHYKTAGEQYPKNYLEPVAFTPKGNEIQLQVVSSPRADGSDKSGIAFTVLNKTNLKLVITVHDDDSKRPRITWTKKEGDIVVQ